MKLCGTLAITFLSAAQLLAASGDPQLKTNHPFYPGELSCSTFERLFATQAELYQRVTGRAVTSDEDKALASWYWRNLNYAHGEDGRSDCFNKGFANAEWNREYWTGLFAHGFALCGTTHSQYTVEMNRLLGHCRSRCVGVTGHNSFEVFLTGGAYGAGKWALLDHDISTVIFAEDGSRLLSIPEIMPNLVQFKNPSYKPQRQRGWRVAGLHPGDAGTYSSFQSVEYLAGYAGPPPMIHLRKGESLRRYAEPGLDDGKTFVFWGRNYNTAGIPGPERSRAWVNQPEKMFGAKTDTGHLDGRVRYGNAVYTYTPDFASGAYKEAVISEGPDHVIFEFSTPYVIAATSPNDKPWGIYDAGCTNGLVITGDLSIPIAVSTNHGRTWTSARAREHQIDLTDSVKGQNQYWLRFDAGIARLESAKLSWRTVCQLNAALIPHLRDGKNRITFASTGRATSPDGPNADQLRIVDGKLGADSVTIELKAPRNEKAVHLHAASWNASGNPPDDTAYRIDYSLDQGKTWEGVVKDWRIVRRQPEPRDFWSQSFTYGDVRLGPTPSPIQVRFSNTGRRSYRKVETYLTYAVSNPSPTQVTLAWTEGGGGLKTATHVYPAGTTNDPSWSFTTGKNVKTRWVEYAAN